MQPQYWIFALVAGILAIELATGRHKGVHRKQDFWIIGSVILGSQVTRIGMAWLTAAIDFGTVSDFAAARTANSLTTLKCTPNAVATVTVSNGGNVNGTQRRLKSGTNFIDYNLTDASNAAWPTAGLSFTGTGADVSLGLKGVVPVQSAKPAGAYSDQVTITVTY